MGQDTVTVTEAGHALGVSTSTVWRMIRSGELPTVRDRGRRLVLTRALRVRRPRSARGDVPPLTPDHPLFRLVGAGHGGGRAPGARDKHAILAR
jgi:excisionase family DNA binding protein